MERSATITDQNRAIERYRISAAYTKCVVVHRVGIGIPRKLVGVKNKMRRTIGQKQNYNEQKLQLILIF